MILKHLFGFYCSLALPLMTLVLGARYQFISSNFFVFGLLLYCLIYHPAICGLRLLALAKIRSDKFWYNFVPGWNQKFYSTLFLNKNLPELKD